ncbi:hypothetical protein [Paracidovorax citrulli]|uniref:Uncharacterized protein n=1 Tax=Paracidovorax citrulli TaxID=80869 RepID=A0ABY9AS34_PARCI|nr:hypothetical protein [Paracidovorax citrulli]PVY64224.1 hypothetical protein C8E08_1537 [Paracidovorax citrulli]REG71574.1 hypothetical protein C8E07_4830 [Paracidovorax citrulli]RLJ96127.1 hypothetical protein C8E06_4825 [Paracidovorax citrulli]WIY30009.1 hypothetical protein QRO09_23835 [Paracidovorax citrulli]WIY39229.1 hypothetical protein QRO10_24030 [Paracidovorax citrulli]
MDPILGQIIFWATPWTPASGTPAAPVSIPVTGITLQPGTR